MGDFDNGTDSYSVRAGDENRPVTYLGLSEARAYCEWAGKRLPHSFEWHYAAQGNSSFLYPWGDSLEMGTNFPAQQHGRAIPGPAAVDAFGAKGESMFGVRDLIGNVWQFTDEVTDAHSRAVVVMGGANYRPDGSQWYFPNAFALNEHNKYFLMDDAYERCGTIGFRCAADAEQPQNERPFNWNGDGVYCLTEHGMPSNFSTELCGRLGPQRGRNNLTAVGTLDWAQFGANDADSSQLKLTRKATNNAFFASFSTNSATATGYENNLNGFFWSDGEAPISKLSEADATPNGIWISQSALTFDFEIAQIGADAKFALKVFVGVYRNRGALSVTLSVGGEEFTFRDGTLFNGAESTSNAVYDVVIDLTAQKYRGLSATVSVSWAYVKGEGNVTLQALALAMLKS